MWIIVPEYANKEISAKNESPINSTGSGQRPMFLMDHKARVLYHLFQTEMYYVTSIKSTIVNYSIYVH
jgi:hypothetical protein